jgi:hypothetical protein
VETLVKCKYCYQFVDYANHLGECPAVRFAFEPGYTPYTGGHSIDTEHPEKYRGVALSHAVLQVRQPKQARPYQARLKLSANHLPCHTPGCDRTRAAGRPNCPEHERLALRLRRQQRKD